MRKPRRSALYCIGGTLISYGRAYNNLMVITESPSILATDGPDLQTTAHLYKALGNPTRLRILHALESRSLSFTELMRTLELNPKTLSSGLNLMVECGLVRKSYPHQVYVITPLGRRIIREQVLPLQDSLQRPPAFERRPS